MLQSARNLLLRTHLLPLLRKPNTHFLRTTRVRVRVRVRVSPPPHLRDFHPQSPPPGGLLFVNSGSYERYWRLRNGVLPEFVCV